LLTRFSGLVAVTELVDRLNMITLLDRKHSVIPSAELSRRGPLCQGSAAR